MKTKNTFFICLLFVLAGFMIHNSTQAQSWSPLGNGTDGTVSATCVFNDELYVGGTFTTAGNISASNIAKWNGKQWLALGKGFDASVNTICVFNGELYAGGMFTSSGTDATSHIAKWNGTSWIPVGTGIDGRVSAMVVFNNELYAGGLFTKAGDIPTSNIAKWNGTQWSVVGTGVAKWENNAWNVVGSGINGRVYSFCVFEGSLYVGGRFTFAGVTPANYIAKWDGTNFSALSTGLSIISTSEPFATSLTVYNNELYVTGVFSTADNTTVNNIAKWNGKKFLPIGTGIEYSSTGESMGRTLIVFNGELYVGGIFNNAGSNPATNLAKWNGKAWSAVDFKSNQILCLAEYKNSLIIGGTFKGTKEVPSNIASFCPYSKAEYTLDPSIGKTQPMEVKFTNNSTGSKQINYLWDFGDGTSSNEASPSHSFNKYGSTGVTLYATAMEGCTSTKIKYVTIDTMPPAKPVITETKNVLSIENPQPNEKYQWYLNDEIIADANNSSYTAEKTGYYKITVTNATGSSTSDKFSLVVVDNAKIAFNNLDINNINARFNSEGSMFWDFNDPAFESPKGSGRSTIYTGALWVGGYSSLNHKLHLASQTYRRKGTDFWAGPVMKPESYSDIQDDLWNKVWKITKEDIENQKAHWQEPTYKMPESIANWPGNGNTAMGQSRELAPYVDINTNGYYDPKNGDYPLIKGDQAILFIFNDDRDKHGETQGEKLGIQVLGLAYAFKAPKDSALNNTIFLNYKIINRSRQQYDSVYVGLLTDFDIGMSSDDYIGCDLMLNTYFGYNGDNFDEGTYGYGKTPPAQGVTILSEPLTNFMYYNNTGVGKPIAQDPETAENYYNYMRSLWKNNSHATYGGNGYGGKTPVNFVFSEWYGGWTESSAGNKPGDRRGLGSIGPFTLKPGDFRSIDVAYITACDYSANMLSVDLLKQRVVKIIDYYKANLEGK